MGLEALALVGTIASAGIGAVGAMQSASAQKSQADYQAAVARNNATIARQNAEQTAEAGAVAAQNSSLKAGAMTSGARAMAAAHGIDVNSGSAQDVQDSSQKIGLMDALTVYNNSEQKAYGQMSQAKNFDYEAQLDTMKGDSASSAGMIGAMSSLVSGASSFSSKWMSFSNAGTI